MQINKITTANPATALGKAPSPNQFMSRDPISQGYQQTQDRRKAEEKSKQQEELASQDRQIQAMEKMRDNPQQAQQIAGVYGMEYTPEMDALIKDKQKMTLTTEALKMAKDMGIKNPRAAAQFTKDYVLSGGDFQKAQRGLGGMRLEAAKGYKAPSTSGMPKGYQRDPRTGAAVQIPGTTPEMYEVGQTKKPVTASTAGKIYDDSEESLIAQRLKLEYPEIADDNASVDGEAMRHIQRGIADKMGRHGDFEKAFRDTIEEIGITRQNNDTWNPFGDDYRYGLPAGAPSAQSPAEMSPEQIQQRIQELKAKQGS